MVYLVFLIQNFSKDISTLIVKKSRSIGASEVEGQEIIRKIDNLALYGFELIDKSNVRIIYKKNAEFYIELITDKLDTSNRPAKIGIYGRKPSLSWEYSFEDWVFDVFDRVKEFSIKIDRSVTQEQLQVIRLGLKSIHYKQKKRSMFLIIVKVIIGFIIPILLGLLLQLSPVFNFDTTLLLSFFTSVNNIFIILLIQEKV
ncbi:hypothetical protein [Coleofasciculus sp. E1-EBD-02]|uniref:hypothetical protein n=1 Tax=Coleofasciculus sp. E1-EBD-02 TaxID=3068481 RepID=UPI00330190CD